jgi:cellulose synthase/poly-beta-1,6-N-acetylglucosamine synthase-like glycosyltransferase
MHQIPFENLIVVYGTSLDSTKETAYKYTNNVFWDGDKGLGAARSLGVKKATSEIVAMIDSDVVLTKGWFRQLIGHFQNPKVAAVNGTCIYGHGCKPLESYWEYIRRTAPVNVGCHNTMFRREAVLKVGNFDETIQGAGEDYDLYFRLLAAGYRWVWVKEATVYHPMSMLEFLKHVRWWSRGRTATDRLYAQIADASLARVYGRLVLSIPLSVGEGLKLSFLVHPALLFYSPLINVVNVSENLRSLKNLHNTSEPSLIASKMV